MSPRSGRCMCGAVSFSAHNVPATFGACHCEMCRRWTGSALMGVTVPRDAVTWEGNEHIATLQSSDWAERAWCALCGTGLYYRVTTDGPMAANYEIPVGLFDDLTGMKLVNEIYIDHKPEAYAYAGQHKRMTRQETLAQFGIAEDGL